jgi:hypothetical protein
MMVRLSTFYAQYLILLIVAQSRLRIEAGSVASNAALPLDGFAINALIIHYNRAGDRVYGALDRNPPRGTCRLKTSATFFDYILLNGRRIVPVQRTLRKSAGSSIVKAIIHGKKYCGTVHSFFRHDQPDIFDGTIWAELAWMEEQDLSAVNDDPWSDL